MPRPEGKFRRKRHPLCPECKYDLIATVEAGRNVCPECGYEFEEWELRDEKRPGEWTPLIGLRHAAVSLVLRSLVLLPLWVGVLWGMMAFLSRFSRFNAFILPLFGIFMGFGLSARLTDRAGFASQILLYMAWVFAVIVVLAGIVIADLIVPMAPMAKLASGALTGVAAVLWILKVIVLDD